VARGSETAGEQGAAADAPSRRNPRSAFQSSARLSADFSLRHQESVVHMAKTDSSWWRVLWRGGLAAGVVLILVGVTVSLGLTASTVLRVPSPDGRHVAVCRAIPVLDGPDYEVRLERSDGTVVIPLYRVGDGEPCVEVIWADDSSTLAVLTGHVARIRFVDVSRVLGHPGQAFHYWSWPQIDLSTPEQPRAGSGLRFVGPREVELELRSRTTGFAVRQRVMVPER
jgi:hypothetical protein